MSDGADHPSAFEIKLTARAREMIFRVAGEAEWHTEGTVRVERVSRRDSLPSPIQPEVPYTNVRVSSYLKAWLDENGTGSRRRDSPAADPARHREPHRRNDAR